MTTTPYFDITGVDPDSFPEEMRPAIHAEQLAERDGTLLSAARALVALADDPFRMDPGPRTAAAIERLRRALTARAAAPAVAQPLRLTQYAGHLCIEVGRHTCGAGGEHGHEPHCGLDPIAPVEDVHAALNELTDEQRTLVGRSTEWWAGYRAGTAASHDHRCDATSADRDRLRDELHQTRITCERRIEDLQAEHARNLRGAERAAARRAAEQGGVQA